MNTLQAGQAAKTISTRRLVLGAAVFATIWTLGMFWWSGDYTFVNFAILALCGVVVAAAWTWAMRRFGYLR
jgi:hypothetical protein